MLFILRLFSSVSFVQHYSVLLFTVLLIMLCAAFLPWHFASRDQPILRTHRPTAPDQSCSKPSVADSIIEVDMTEDTRDAPSGSEQPYDAFLVLDVEATCQEGTKFDYANEIIEWPVCLLRWKDKDPYGRATQLEIVEEYRSFVRPTWRPNLSQFCTDLTGITQEQVDAAPTFTQLVADFRGFLERHRLIERGTGRKLARFCWCSDGPFDIRDFVVKQCFISKIPLPNWISGDILDVRSAVAEWSLTHVRDVKAQHRAEDDAEPERAFHIPKRLSPSIPRQLQILGLTPFEGRPHSGIDDTRNITRIVIELARRGVRLRPNKTINPKRRWPWMGKQGKIKEGYF